MSSAIAQRITERQVAGDTFVHYRDNHTTVLHGDVMDVLPTLADNSIDAIVCDPPYALAFMGSKWDAYGSNAFQKWCEVWATECLRVLKPGGHLLAFGATRTYHRLACGIEDAGFDIRDSICWLYGSGFPKSLDVSKAIDKAAGAEREIVGRRIHPTLKNPAKVKSLAFHVPTLGSDKDAESWDITAPATDDAAKWQGWGTALKPAAEPIVVARKPPIGTVVENVLEYGTGAINIDACRTEVVGDRTLFVKQGNEDSINQSICGSGISANSRPGGTTSKGRWPANIILDEHMASALDEQSGVLSTSGANTSRRVDRGPFSTGDAEMEIIHLYDDKGGASRFFPVIAHDPLDGVLPFKYQAKAPKKERPNVEGLAHPTVKPLGIISWLIQLVTPPGGTVLDLFGGSGTTAEAAIDLDIKSILVEREADYLPLIDFRIERALKRKADGK